MTCAARPALRGMAPSEVLGDVQLAPIAAGQSLRKAGGLIADSWDFFNPVAFDDVVASGFFLAGPVSGLPSAPSFRAIVQSDLPGGINYTTTADGTVPAGNTVSNTTADTAFASVNSIAANFLTVGSLIRVHARGTVSTALANVSFTFRIRYGAVLLLLGNVTVPNGVVNGGFEVTADLLVTAIGGAGTLECNGTLTVGNISSGAAAGVPGGAQGVIGSMMVNIAPITATTASLRDIVLSVQMGAAAAAVKAVLRSFVVDIIRP
jgi:hypothetical protein